MVGYCHGARNTSYAGAGREHEKSLPLSNAAGAGIDMAYAPGDFPLLDGEGLGVADEDRERVQSPPPLPTAREGEGKKGNRDAT